MDNNIAMQPTVTDEHCRMFLETFVNRLDLVPFQRADGTYTFRRRPFTLDIARAHLTGKVTVGFLIGQDSRVKHGVVDIDEANPDAVAEVWRRCDAIGLPVMNTWSGRKGYHVMTLFDGPTPADRARAVMLLVAGDHEVWPRQGRLEPGSVGNIIKAPFGVHRVTGKWCVAVNRNFEKVADHWALITETPRANADAVLAEAFLRQQGCPSSRAPVATPATMKPCLAEQFRDGTDEGRRNRVGFALATEFRRLDLPEVRALEHLRAWNTRNHPPLRDREVDTACQSAYGRARPYEYGCRPDGALRQIVECPGRSKCDWYRRMRQQAGDRQDAQETATNERVRA